MLNEILFIIVGVCYLYNFNLLRKNSKLISYTGSSSEILREALIELSLTFVNQELEITSQEHAVKISLIKYQFKNYWGIRLIIGELDTLHKNRLFLLLNEEFNDLNYEVNLSEMIIDCRNDIDLLVRLIEQFFSKILSYSTNSTLIFVFNKKSVIT